MLIKYCLINSINNKFESFSTNNTYSQTLENLKTNIVKNNVCLNGFPCVVSNAKNVSNIRSANCKKVISDKTECGGYVVAYNGIQLYMQSYNTYKILCGLLVKKQPRKWIIVNSTNIPFTTIIPKNITIPTINTTITTAPNTTYTPSLITKETDLRPSILSDYLEKIRFISYVRNETNFVKCVNQTYGNNSLVKNIDSVLKNAFNNTKFFK